MANRLFRLVAVGLLTVFLFFGPAVTARAADPVTAAALFKSLDEVCGPSDPVTKKRLLDPSRALYSLISQNNLSDLAIHWSLQKTSNPTPGVDPIIDAMTDIVYNPDFCTTNPVCGPPAGKTDTTPGTAARQAALARLVSATLFPSDAHQFARSSLTVTFTPIGKTAASGRDYLLHPAQYPLACVDLTGNNASVQAEKSVTSLVKKYLRLRGVAAQLTVPQTVSGAAAPQDASGVSSNQYLSGTGGKLSFGQANGSTATTDSIVGTLGIALHPTDFGGSDDIIGPLRDAAFVPYIAIDREGKIQTTKGVTGETFTANTLDYGFLVEGNAGLPENPLVKQLELAIRPDYLRNFLDGSDIFAYHTTIAPLNKSLGLNELRAIAAPLPLRYMIQFDLRADLGWFTDHGHPTDPRLNEDFVRLGGMIGPQFEFTLPDMPDYPVDVGTTYTDFFAARGFSKSLGDLQAAASFNFSPEKILALTIAYVNGRRDDTAQRVEMWSVGITLHF